MTVTAIALRLTTNRYTTRPDRRAQVNPFSYTS